MRVAPVLLLVLLLSTPPVAGDKPAAKYESATGGYRVRFPGEPTVEVTPAKGDKPARATAAFTDEKAARFYAVAVTDFPPAEGKSFQLDAAVEAVVDGWGMKATEVKKVEFGAGKLPARDVRARQDGGTAVSRSYFIFDAEKRRLYIVYMSSAMDAVAGKFADAFLDSFELTPKK